MVIDGVFEHAPAERVVFHSAIGVHATAIARVQACVRRRLRRIFVRLGLLPGDAAPVTGAMGTRLLRGRLGAQRGRSSPWNGRRELDPERLIYDHRRRGPGGSDRCS